MFVFSSFFFSFFYFFPQSDFQKIRSGEDTKTQNNNPNCLQLQSIVVKPKGGGIHEHLKLSSDCSLQNKDRNS